MLEFTIDYNKTIPGTVEALRSFISKDFPYIPIFLLTRFELEFNNLLQNFGIFCEHFYLMVFWVRIPSWFQCNRPPKIYYILLSKTYERNVYTIVTLCVGRIVSIIGALSIYRASSHPLSPLSLSLSFSFIFPRARLWHWMWQMEPTQTDIVYESAYGSRGRSTMFIWLYLHMFSSCHTYRTSRVEDVTFVLQQRLLGSVLYLHF